MPRGTYTDISINIVYYFDNFKLFNIIKLNEQQLYIIIHRY